MLSRAGKDLKDKTARGFTIIEVMIVLAVAGLIMAIVLVAIPQVQRSQRNSARKDILARVSTEMNTYAGNNTGKIPTSEDNLDGVVARYLEGVNLADPQSGEDMIVEYADTAQAGLPSPSNGSLPEIGTMNYMDGFVCDGEELVIGSARQFALWTQLEGGSIFCVDNK